jgi:hypothetical protein
MYVPSSELGLFHPLSRQRVCPSPRNGTKGGRGSALACGWGGVQIPTTGETAKRSAYSVLIPDGDDIRLPPALAGEGGIGEYLAGVPVDDIESLHLARVTEIVGHRLVRAQVWVLGRHLQYVA